jgi:hypothetical protein
MSFRGPAGPPLQAEKFGDEWFRPTCEAKKWLKGVDALLVRGPADSSQGEVIERRHRRILFGETYSSSEPSSWKGFKAASGDVRPPPPFRVTDLPSSFLLPLPRTEFSFKNPSLTNPSGWRQDPFSSHFGRRTVDSGKGPQDILRRGRWRGRTPSVNPKKVSSLKCCRQGTRLRTLNLGITFGERFFLT